MNLPGLWDTIENYLFPGLEELLGEELSNKEKEFVRICTISELDQFSHEFEWCGFERPPKGHFNILKAYIAKSVYNFASSPIFMGKLWLRKISKLMIKRNLHNFERPKTKSFSDSQINFSI